MQDTLPHPHRKEPVGYSDNNFLMSFPANSLPLIFFFFFDHVFSLWIIFFCFFVCLVFSMRCQVL